MLGIVEQETNRSVIWYIACHSMSWRTRDILNNANPVQSPRGVGEMNEMVSLKMDVNFETSL